MISVESKAVSDHAETPSRNGQFPPRRQEGRLHDSQLKMESAMSELCSDKMIPGFRPFHLPESKATAMGRHKGSFSYLLPLFLFFYYSTMPADRDLGMKVRVSQKSKPRKHLGDTNGILEGISD